MPDQLERLLARAALDLLDANASIVHYATKVADQAQPPYVLSYTQVSWPNGGNADALDGKSVTANVTWTLHCVGESPDAVLVLQDQVRETLLNARPTVAGRACNRIRQDEVLAPAPDESLGRLVIDGVVTYSLFSAPG